MLAGGWRDLGAHLDLLEHACVPLVHIDVMDGRFCPIRLNDPATVAAIETSLFKDVHLLVDEPLDQIADYARAGADLLTVHVESTRDPAGTLRAIGELSNANDTRRTVLRGLALLPTTPVDAVDTLLDLADVLLILAVSPGVEGPDPSARARLARAAELVRGRDVLIGFDGGVRSADAGELAALGANLIVTGSAVFAGDRPPAQLLAAMQADLA